MTVIHKKVSIETRGKKQGGMMERAKTDTGIKEEVLNEICRFAEEYQIEKVILFGSRARGDYKERSDIDLAISGGDIVRFSLDVDEQTHTLLKFDFVNMNRSVQEELLESIKREGVVIYEKV